MGEQIKKGKPVSQVPAHHDRGLAEHRLILLTLPDDPLPSLTPHHKQAAYIKGAREIAEKQQSRIQK
jgi:hypothetical protein